MKLMWKKTRYPNSKQHFLSSHVQIQHPFIKTKINHLHCEALFGWDDFYQLLSFPKNSIYISNISDGNWITATPWGIEVVGTISPQRSTIVHRTVIDRSVNLTTINANGRRDRSFTNEIPIIHLKNLKLAPMYFQNLGSTSGKTIPP